MSMISDFHRVSSMAARIFTAAVLPIKIMSDQMRSKVVKTKEELKSGHSKRYVL